MYHGQPSVVLQDIGKARRSAMDYLNGLVVRKGREKEIVTPLNEAVVNSVQRLLFVLEQVLEARERPVGRRRHLLASRRRPVIPLLI